MTRTKRKATAPNTLQNNVTAIETNGSLADLLKSSANCAVCGCLSCFDGSRVTTCCLSARYCKHCILPYLLEHGGKCPACGETVTQAKIKADPVFDALIKHTIEQLPQHEQDPLAEQAQGQLLVQPPPSSPPPMSNQPPATVFQAQQQQPTSNSFRRTASSTNGLQQTETATAADPFKGVSKHGSLWKAEGTISAPIRVGGDAAAIDLGVYEHAKEAACVYDAYLLNVMGVAECPAESLNFESNREVFQELSKALQFKERPRTMWEVSTVNWR